MVARLPMRDLIVPKARPQTTLSLVPALRDHAQTMVESYVFTDTIRSHCETILESVASGAGQGFWVQAEYGAGKTHFLVVLAALLSDTSDAVWAGVTDATIALYQRRLQNTRLFPVLVSLRGESQADAFTEQSLLDIVLEKGFRPTLEHTGLGERVQLTAADDLLDWLDRLAPRSIREEVEAYLHAKTRQSLRDYVHQEGSTAAARFVASYCREHAINPVLAAGIRSRLAHVYHQITANGDPAYSGLLVIIDEYEGWQKNRTSPEASSQDSDFLETLAYLLPKDLGLQVHTIVASQSDVPAKLMGAQEGDRFVRIPLLAERNVHDYDIIVSRRVRGLREDRLPEIRDHYTYYRDSFEFARKLSESEFADMFPFQPRCFEVVRRITARDLPTARSGILIFHELVSDPELQGRDLLIRVCDLLRSRHLQEDCLTSAVYREALNAYRIAREALPTLGLEPTDVPLAEDLLATLFLWYLAHMERPLPMSLRDLAQATLTRDDFMKAEDNVLYVLNQMRPLPQVAFDGKEAYFEPKGTEGIQVTALFNEFVKRVSGDPYRVRAAWSDSLFMTQSDTRTHLVGLFSDLVRDEPTSLRLAHRNLDYQGEVVIGSRWRADWQLPLPKEDRHFRLVVLSPDAAESVRSEDLQDRRIAVIYPGALTDEASQAASRWLAWQEMDTRYRDEAGRDGTVIREWLDAQRATYLSSLLETHLPVYRNGRVISRDDLAVNAREVFNQPSNNQRFSFVVEKVLSAAYDQLPVDTAALRSTLTATEAGKVYDGYFGPDPGSTQTAAMRNYGIGLRLSHPDQPARFAPQPDCRALGIIREMLGERGGSELPVWRIYERLSAPPYGLPYIVIQLYILACVRLNDPRVELVLKRDHKLKTRSGKPLSRDRLSASNVPEAAWRPADFERYFDALIPVAGPSWNDAVPFARELVADLRTSTDQGDIETQSQRLEAELGRLEQELRASHDALGTLERSLKAKLPDEDRESQALLERLVATRAEGYSVFYEEAVAMCQTPDALRDVLRTHSRLRDLAAKAAEINEVKRYLEAAELRTQDRDLMADRDSLLAQLSLPSLVGQPSLWNSLQASFEQFRDRYRNEYLKYHRDTNEALHKLSVALDAAPRQLRALALLNEVGELGEPRGEGLEAQYERLRRRVEPCPVTDYREVHTDAAPFCARCERKLTDAPPVEPVEGFLHALDEALGDQRRRLASEAIRRVLASSQEGAVSRFVQAVQTANVAALVDVLDERTVDLIRELLAKDQVATVPCDLLRQFAHEYPTLEESDIPKAVERLRQLLREYFAEARRVNADKKAVRLTLR